MKAVRNLSVDSVNDVFSLRLLWKVTLTSDGKPTGVYGFRSISFPFADSSTSSAPDVCDSLQQTLNDDFLSVTSSLDPVTQPLLFDVIDWRVEVDTEDVTNVGWLDVNIVPMKLRLMCTSVMTKDTTFRVSVEFRTAIKSFPVGSRKEAMVLVPGEIKVLMFHYCFMVAGTYNMAEFVSVKAVCDVIPDLKVPKIQKPSTNQMLLQVG